MAPAARASAPPRGPAEPIAIIAPMTTWDLVELPWLAPPPADLRGAIAALQAGDEDRSVAARALASTRLDRSGTRKLAAALAGLHDAGRLARLAPLRLGVLSATTIDTMAAALTVAAARHGVALTLRVGPYDQARRVATDPEHAFHTDLDLVLYAPHAESLGLATAPGDAAAADEAIGFAGGVARAIVEGARQHAGVPVVVQTLAPPAAALFGSLDAAIDGTALRAVDRLNEILRTLGTGGDALLLDVARVAATAGLHRWHDPVDWAWAKVPISRACVPLYADHLGRLLGAHAGKSRRALVLDLDHTVWGGVIGDDGVDGIAVGQGSPAGEAHLAVQRAALRLRERGVVLAVASKNTDAVARRGFTDHPDMLLRLEHIAVFQANWNPKPQNLEAISAALSLGLESLVFLDDNPAERAAVRESLPECAVPELPDEPALFAPTLLAAGYFEAARFTTADLDRARQYDDNARRAELAATAHDQGAFLRSLRMTARLAPFDDVGRPRIAQLIGKSNQFNLTTRRYSEPQVAQLAADPDVFTLQVRLVDRFGDNGMISVLIVRRDGATHVIDTWLMSCRVLGRRVEDLVLDALVAQAARDGATRLRGEYLPTARNELVRDHYAGLGFSPEGDDGRWWSLDVVGYTPRRPPIEVD